MTMNLTAAILAVIITIPSLFALMLLATLTRKSREGTLAEMVATKYNVAYYQTNTATVPEIQTEENVAYSHTELVDTTENVAYGTNIAIAPEIQVEINVAYSCKPNDNPSVPAQDSPSSNK